MDKIEKRNARIFALKMAYAYEMTQKALNYFMDSNAVEISENTATESAIKDMRRLRKNLNDIYIPSIEEIAAENNIELD